jgi:hypothetical protein
VLSKQFRIVFGAFNLAREAVSPDVRGFEYPPDAAFNHNPQETRIKNWLTAKYSVAPSPDGSAEPVFPYCHGSVCQKEGGGGSRSNDRLNALTVEVVQKLVALGIEASDIVIFTPYRANLARLQAPSKPRA